MAEDVMSLFEQYVASYERGEEPDLRGYLERAGDGREELASLVDVWLQVAPAPEPSEEAVALAQAWTAGEPPILTLRVRRGLRRADVVERIVERFSLDPAKRDKVERYYHEVETGQLRPSPRIREALEALLGRAGLAWKALPLAPPEPAYFRSDLALPARTIGQRAAQEPWDEIDELFRGKDD